MLTLTSTIQRTVRLYGDRIAILHPERHFTWDQFTERVARAAAVLRGPVIKSEDAYHGWVDLTSANMETWRERFLSIRAMMGDELKGDTSSRYDRGLTASSEWHVEDDSFNIGEVVAWIFTWEEQGQRGKN